MADSTNPNGIKSLGTSLLPNFYRTDANKKFIHATIDQLIQPGTVKKVSGFVGRQYSKAATGVDIYLQAPDKTRQDYQLEPGLVVNDELGNTTFFKDYIDYINQLNVFGANTDNHSRLNKQEFYSWDPHIDWDKFVNFQNYYWLPYGPSTVRVFGQQLGITSEYNVDLQTVGVDNQYVFSPDGSTPNPVLKLYRGQTYTFNVSSQSHPFSFMLSREIGPGQRYIDGGIDVFGIEAGTITWTVPLNAPSLLYYQSEVDINLGGAIVILSIDENSSIDVENDVIGKVSYTLSNGTPLMNGMKLSFGGNVTPASYATGEYYVEGVGNSIQLINKDILEVTSTYSTPLTILFDAEKFDTTPFSDAAGFAQTLDYITINRASRDHNPWSRYNRWFHSDTITTSALINGVEPQLDQLARANRPIIEFEANLRLFNFGTHAVTDVDLIDTFTADVLSTIEGSIGYSVDGVSLSQNQRILFTADTDIRTNNKIYQVDFINIQGRRQVHLIEIGTPDIDQVILIKSGKLNSGSMRWFNGTAWLPAQQKTDTNQAPLFDVFDSNEISFGDNTVYQGSTFTGTSIFSYKAGTGVNDNSLGFPLAFKNISNIGDIVFNFTLLSDIFKFKQDSAIVSKKINVGFLQKENFVGNKLFVNGWQTSTLENTQAAVRIYKNSNIEFEFDLDIFDDINDLDDLELRVYVDGTQLPPELWELAAGPVYKKIILKPGVGLLGQALTETTNFGGLDPTSVLTVRAFAKQPINSNGFYELPINLQNNPLNGTVGEFTLGEVIDHVNSIVVNLGNTFIGDFPGESNLRNLGNITPYGTKFVQHSGPAGLSLYHITSETKNIVKAIEQSRDDYGKFKRTFIKLATELGVDADPVSQVDQILISLNKNKSKNAPYYFSDMVPYGGNVQTTITVVDSRIRTYPLSDVFSLDVLSNKSVLIYHNGFNGTQLLYGIDYTFNSQGFIEITDAVTLTAGDTITTIEYQTTDGCYVPETPTKLGIWPKYAPTIYLDTTLVTPTMVIQGHDGSIVAAYNDYRDAIILELEKRIFNNIKVEYNKTIFNIESIIPSYNRKTDYSLDEFNAVLAPNFYKWSVLIDKDFSKPIGYDRGNSFTYNYTGFVAPDGQNVPAYWRGIYRWLLDTDRPHLCPWEMLGYSIQPVWWETVYGPAPYTSDNRVMWQDIANGTIKDPSQPLYSNPAYAKPYLATRIPVNEQGELISPLESGLAFGQATSSIANTFVFGDISPAESAWRRSSFYPFSVLVTAMLLNPSSTFGILLDRSRVVRNITGQLVYSETGLRITPTDIVLPSIYSSNSRVQTAGIINYIVNYILSETLVSYEGYAYDLMHLNAQISYRVGGFTGKQKFNLLLDSKTPLSTGSIFIPQEDYSVTLNSSSPTRKITYSGVIITKLPTGFEVKGYSRIQPYFKYYKYQTIGKLINVGGISEPYTTWTAQKYYAAGSIVKYGATYLRTKVGHNTNNVFNPNNYQQLTELPIVGGVNAFLRKSWDRDHAITVPYGTEFLTIQEVVDFLLGYGEWLKDQGFVFDDFNSGLNAVTNWETSAREFMFWTTQNWSSGQDKWDEWFPETTILFGTIVRYNGEFYRALKNVPASSYFITEDFIKLDGLSTIGSSVISLSPSAAKVTFNAPLNVVDDITNPFNGYDIVKVDGTPIEQHLLNSYRENNFVSYTPNSDDGIYGATFYLIQKEQVVILNNTTMFNDTIYNPESGYKQDRIKVSGYVSIDWYGGFDVPGFIFDQAKISNWSAWTDYALGDIVKYQNYYYSASAFLSGTATFTATDWVKLDNAPSSQLLPNWSYKASQFTDFYSLDSDNFDDQQQKVAQHLIGYQKRQYLENIIQNDVSEYKFYQGMIREKGTQNVLNKLFDVISSKSSESITFNEEWAIRVGQYGSSGAFEDIEFVLDEQLFKNNPQGVELVNQVDTSIYDFIIRQTPNDVYVKPIGYTSKPWPLLKNYNSYLRSAGYVRSSDVKITLPTIGDIVNQDITKFSNGDYVWCTFEGASWNVYRFTDINLKVTNATYDATSTLLTITTTELVTLDEGTYIGITQVTGFAGFYQISSVALNSFSCFATITGFPNPFTQQSSITIYSLITQRTQTIDTIDAILPPKLLEGEILWTDDRGDDSGKWAAWQYQSVYNQTEISNSTPQSGLGFGRTIAISKLGNISATSTNTGLVIVYDKAGPATQWIQRQTILAPFIEPYGYNAISKMATTIAISPDNTWLAIGSPLVGQAFTKLLGVWSSIPTYRVNDIVSVNPTSAGSVYYQALQSVPSNKPPASNPIYWIQLNYLPIDSSGASINLLEHGVVSLYEKDANNIYTLVDSILSPIPTAHEKFGSTLLFGNNSLFIGASGYSSVGRVYRLKYSTTIHATSAYNPVGSGGTLLVVTSTVGIQANMTVQGSGFTSDQTVLYVLTKISFATSNLKTTQVGMSVSGVDVLPGVTIVSKGSVAANSSYVIVQGPQDMSTSVTAVVFDNNPVLAFAVTSIESMNTIELSGVPNSTPSGQLNFVTLGWTNDLPATLNGYDQYGNFGNSLALSQDEKQLVVSASDGTVPGVVYIFENNASNTLYTLQQRIPTLIQQSNNPQSIAFGRGISISQDGNYLTVADSLATDLKTNQGAVVVWKKQNNSSTYAIAQELVNHHAEISGFFGSKVSFMNNSNTIVVYSANESTILSMTFDVHTLHYDASAIAASAPSLTKYSLDPTSPLAVVPTTFDGNSTTFSTTDFGSGRVDIYDRYANNWVYSETLATSNIVGEGYGLGFAVGANQIFVGAPQAPIQTTTGKLISGRLYNYGKMYGEYSWTIAYQQTDIADVSKIKKAFLYDRTTNQLINYIDVIDPAQGKIPGIAEEELTYKTFYDPAVYSIGTEAVTIDTSASWGQDQVGRLWWDLRTAKFINAYEDDVVYRNNIWNTLAVGASIDVYEWVATSLKPSAWDTQADTNAGLANGVSGTSLYGNNVYSTTEKYDTTSQKTVVTYYYWVKNKTTVPNRSNRHLSASEVSGLIANPRGQDYKFLALTGLNSFSLANVRTLLKNTDVILAVEYWTIDKTDQNVHSQWKIINNSLSTVLPISIEQKWVDSLSGKDIVGRAVPDPTLPVKLRYGIENRPRQGMFVNRFEALKQIFEQANLILINQQITQSRNISKLLSTDPIPSTITSLYDRVVDTKLDLTQITSNNSKTAVVTPVVSSDGAIIGVTVVSAGQGYLIAPFITITGKGTGAVVKAIINSANGSVTGAIIINGGEGYVASTTICSIRPYSVLVNSDEDSNGSWSIYAFDSINQIWSLASSKTYDVSQYWNYANWYDTGFNQFTAEDFIVNTFTDLNTINVAVGELVRVQNSGSGGWELLEKYANSQSLDWSASYRVVGIQSGTIQFNSSIYEYNNTGYGYDNSTYDGIAFDNGASVELRIILDAFKNDIFIDDLRTSYLDIFFTSIRYAHTEQNYIDWIFKTSFVKAQHNIGEFLATQPITYKPDNLPDFEDYINEVKPYRTKIREYISSFSGTDPGFTAISDFDLPPVYENGKSTQLQPYVQNGDIASEDNNINLYPWKNWLDHVGFSVIDIKLIDGGSGYITEPVVTIASNDIGSGATARAFISRGKVNRIVLTNINQDGSTGTGYLSAPSVIINGGLNIGGTPARAVAIIGNSVVRSSLIKIKFDRTSQTYQLAQLQQTDKFVGTGSKKEFRLTWAPDIRANKASVTVDGIDTLRDLYTLTILSSMVNGETRYTGQITFTNPPAQSASIVVSYLKDWSMLNASDRVQFYYTPEAGDIGKDLAQLMTGVDYGGTTIFGIGFDVGSGWGTLPYYSDKWDSSDPTFDDYIVVVNANVHSFTLPYVPANNTPLNVYYIKKNIDTHAVVDASLGYSFNYAVSTPIVTVSIDHNTVGATTAGSTTLIVSSVTGIIAGISVVTSGITSAFGLNAKVTSIAPYLTNWKLTLDQIVFTSIPNNTPITFTKTLSQPTDLTIYANGSITLVSAPVIGSVINIIGQLAPVRLDDPHYGTPQQTNANAIMTTPIANGVSATFTIPGTFTVNNGDEFIWRKTTSDGAVKPLEQDYDTALSGGNLAYTTATGISADDILVDGDGFVTPTSSPATEEVVPGQIVDAVAIKVYDQPSSGSAEIKIDNYFASGTSKEFLLSVLPNSPQAVIVKVGNIIATQGQDYTVDYRKQTINFVVAPTLNKIVSIFIIGFSGSNILDIDYFVGDGTTLEFLTKAPWLDQITALVYVDGIAQSVNLFKTDKTYENSDRVGIAFITVPPAGSLINFIIVSGTQQTFAITKNEKIHANGNARTFKLAYPVGDSLPLESNMIVRVDQQILSGPINSYFTIENDRLAYDIDPTRFGSYAVSINAISVFADGVLLKLGTNYIVNLSGITITINQLVYNLYKGSTLIISVNSTNGYTYNSTTGSITFNQIYDSTNVIEVITSYRHDILDIQRTAVNISSNLSLVPDTVAYYYYKSVSSGIIQLDRPVVDDNYVWVIKNTLLLTPSVDYKLNDDRTSITLATQPALADQITLITFGNNVLAAGIAYMQFKDMLNRVVFKRLSLRKRTRLATELNYNDITITVDDASNFDQPNPSANKPGIIEIRGERIEYFQINGNILSQLRRGTLGTGVPTKHLVGSFVQDIGSSETIPYSEANVVSQLISDGSNTVSPSFTPGGFTTGCTYKGQLMTSSDITSLAKSAVEVFVGGYDASINWLPNTIFATGTIITVGSYTYKVLAYHKSGDLFSSPVTTLNIDGTVLATNVTATTVYSFFIGNIRLKKNSYRVHNLNVAPTSPEGDLLLNADFTVDGTSRSIALATPLAYGSQVTVVKRVGTDWDRLLNIQYDSGEIGRFLRAEPGVWYTDFKQISTSVQTATSFDSDGTTLDNNNITFDQG